jgi:hypothetical protein
MPNTFTFKTAFTVSATKEAHRNIAFIHETIRRLATGKMVGGPATWVGVSHKPMSKECQADLWYKLLGTETPAMIAACSIDTTGEVLKPDVVFEAKGFVDERFTVKGIVGKDYRILLSVYEEDVPYDNCSTEYKCELHYEGSKESFPNASAHALTFFTKDEDELEKIAIIVRDAYRHKETEIA